jgi:hypothetical protein
MKRLEESLLTTVYHIMVLTNEKSPMSPKELLDRLDNLETEEDVKKLTDEIVEKSHRPEIRDHLYKFILKNTVEQENYEKFLINKYKRK